MKFIFLVIYLSLVVVETTSEKPSQCPSYCTCDRFEYHNRADCSGQRIISSNVDVPAAVEFLDLSYNEISTLDNDCFKDLIYLKLISIANNALHTIYLDAFSPLKEIQLINLSTNRLEYFDDRVFEMNPKLHTLDLSGNKFMTLQNKPFLRSKSLRFLNLQNAQVTYIYPLMFTETPKLDEIDISKNLMITLTPTAFNPLAKLTVLDLQGNRWNCDKSFSTTLQTLKGRNIDVRVDSCAVFEKAEGPPKFERMMLAPESSEKEPTSIENVWKPSQEQATSVSNATCTTDSDSLCQQLRACSSKLLEVSQQKDAHQFFCRGKNLEEELLFALVLGITIGAMVMSVIVFLVCSLRLCKRIKRRKDINSWSYQQFNSPDVDVLRVAPNRPNPPSRPNPPTRRNPRPQRMSSPESRVATRSRNPRSGESNDLASIVSKLFERRSRQQWRRSLHDSQAYMIRRLSQSNLLNMRGSSAAARAASSSSNQATTSEAARGGRSAQQTTSLNTSSVGGSRVSSPVLFCRAEEPPCCVEPPSRRAEMPLHRAETPPPSYDDIDPRLV